MIENSNLKNFISKLNDRNLQRKRESGITSYVLFSVFIFCTYKLYKNFSFYLINITTFNYENSIKLICFISNSLIALYWIVIFFHNEKRTFSNLKILKYDKKKFSLLGYIILLFLFLIPIISTILSYLNRNSELNNLYYYYLGLLNLIPLINLIKPFCSRKKQLKLINTTNENNGSNIIILLVSTSVIIFSIILTYNVPIFEKFIFIKIIILFYIILFILEKIVEQENNDIYTFNLENFEYEIYLKNLNDEQIRERLQENYIGYLIDYWIEFNKRELNELKENVEIKNIELNSKMLILEDTVDKEKYPIEFEARKKTIKEELYNEIQIKLPSLKKTLSEVKKIIKEGTNLNTKELSELTQLEKDLSYTISELSKTES